MSWSDATQPYEISETAAIQLSSMPDPEMLCVYQFKVVLRGISPMIWRRLLLRSNQSIADLHYTIQIAMGWSDSHLHRFHIHGKDYGVAHEGGLTFSDDPKRVLLAQFGFRPRERFLYEYDFYDNWKHGPARGLWRSSGLSGRGRSALADMVGCFPAGRPETDRRDGQTLPRFQGRPL